MEEVKGIKSFIKDAVENSGQKYSEELANDVLKKYNNNYDSIINDIAKENKVKDVDAFRDDIYSRYDFSPSTPDNTLHATEKPQIKVPELAEKQKQFRYNPRVAMGMPIDEAKQIASNVADENIENRGNWKGFGKELGLQAKSSVNDLTAAIYGTPGFVYDFIGSGFRALNIPVPEWDESLFTKDATVGKRDINPLSILEKDKDILLEASRKNTEEVIKLNPDYIKGVQNSFAEGDVDGGIRNLFSSVMRSAAPSAAMMLTGGMSAPAAMGTTSAVFGSMNLNEADQLGEYGNLSRDGVVAVSALTGAIEYIFERNLGSGAAGNAIKKLITEKGEDVAKQQIKKTWQDQVSNMIIRNPWMAPFGEAYEEMGTQLAQNTVNKYSGYMPDIKITDGMVDAGLMGTTSGGIHMSMIKAIQQGMNASGDAISRNQVKKEYNKSIGLLEDIPDANYTEAVYNLTQNYTDPQELFDTFQEINQSFNVSQEDFLKAYEFVLNSARYTQMSKSRAQQIEEGINKYSGTDGNVTTATIDDQEWYIKNPEDLGKPGKIIFAHNENGTKAFQSVKVKDWLSQTPDEVRSTIAQEDEMNEQLAQEQEAIAEQQTLLTGIEEGAEIVNDQSQGNLRVIEFSNGQSKAIDEGQEIVFNTPEELQGFLKDYADEEIKLQQEQAKANGEPVPINLDELTPEERYNELTKEDPEIAGEMLVSDIEEIRTQAEELRNAETGTKSEKLNNLKQAKQLEAEAQRLETLLQQSDEKLAESENNLENNEAKVNQNENQLTDTQIQQQNKVNQNEQPITEAGEQKQQPPYYEDAKNIPVLAQKIINGEQITDEDKQLQANFSKELEKELKRQKRLAALQKKANKPQKPRKLSKVRQDAVSLEVYTPREIVLQYLAGHGKINMAALQSIFGNKKGKSVESERRRRISYYSAEGMGVNEMAHMLWENSGDQIYEKYDSQDFREAVEDVILSFNSSTAMAKELLQNYQTIDEQMMAEAEAMQQAEDENDAEIDDLADKAADNIKNNPVIASENEVDNVILQDYESGQGTTESEANPVRGSRSGNVGENTPGSASNANQRTTNENSVEELSDEWKQDNNVPFRASITEQAQQDLRNRQNAVKALNKLQEQFNIPIQVINSNEMPQEVADRAHRLKVVPKAFYQNGTAYIISDQITSVSDVKKSFLHEAVLHKGLDIIFENGPVTLLGKTYQNKNQFLDEVFRRLDDNTIADRAKDYGKAFFDQLFEQVDGQYRLKDGATYDSLTEDQKRELAEEVLATLSEKESPRLQVLLDSLWKYLKKLIGWSSNQFSKSDLRSMLAEHRKLVKQATGTKAVSSTPGGRSASAGRGSTRFQAAWHGSPHAFDKFSTQFMGTGEGAQAFGWGLYFTDRKGIAKSYANMKPDGTLEDLDQVLKAYYFSPNVIDEIFELHYDNKLADLLNKPFDIETDEEGFTKVKLAGTDIVFSHRYIKEKAIERADKIKSAITGIIKPRNLYKVKIHGDKTLEELNFLRWDKPVNAEQKKAIENEIIKIIKDGRYSELSNSGRIEMDLIGKDGNIYTPVGHLVRDKKLNGGIRVKLPANLTGHEVYSIVSDLFSRNSNQDKEASMLLLNAGIDGIQYPTEYTSKGEHEDSYNYVVFDENAVQIEDHIRFRVMGEWGAYNLDVAEEATTRMDNLEVAKQMEASDKSPKEIKLATGWERGADGKWRYEAEDLNIKNLDRLKEIKANSYFEHNAVDLISIQENEDGTYTVRMRGKGATNTINGFVKFNNLKPNELESFLGKEIANDFKSGKFELKPDIDDDFNEIESYQTQKEYAYETENGMKLNNLIESDVFKAYPSLNDILVYYDHNIKASASFVIDKSGNEYIAINPTLSPNAYKSVLAHEIQHAIQQIEGFAQGGNMRDTKAQDLYKRNQRKNISNRIAELESKLPKFNETWIDGTHDKIADQIEKLKDERLNISNRNVQFDAYHSLAGEVEARNVQSRLNFTPEERANTLLIETEDISREDQIFIRNGMEASIRFRVMQNENFRNWFKNSKITDENGDPAIMYHATNRDFDAFRNDRILYFTDDPEYASMYTAGGAAKGAHYISQKERELEEKTRSGESIMPVFLKAENPFDTRNPEHKAIFDNEFFMKWGNGTPLDAERGLPDWTEADDLKEFFDENDYDFDGLILAESHGQITVAVFNPNQVKSATGNNGEFNPNNNDVRFRVAESKKEINDFIKKSKIKQTVYHGTNYDFTQFDPRTIGHSSGNEGHYGYGFYFSTEEREAKTYGKKIIKANVRIEKPFTGTDEEYEMLKNAGVSDIDDKIDLSFNFKSLHSEINKSNPKAAELLKDLHNLGYEKGWEKFLKTNKIADFEWDLNIVNDIYEASEENNGIRDYIKDDLKSLGVNPENIKTNKGYMYEQSLHWVTDLGNKSKAVTDVMKQLGYDGVIYGTEVVAFYPEQIIVNPQNTIRFRTEEQNKVIQDAKKYDDVNDFINAYEEANFRDMHRAPGNPGEYESMEERMDEGTDFNLAEVAQGYSVQPDDYFDPKNGPRWYGYNDYAGMQSYRAIREAFNKIQEQVFDGEEISDMPTLLAYRAVPNNVDTDVLHDGDWITFSEQYAIDHGEHRFGEDEYKIIVEEVPADQVWWDGNDINEWGYDTGETEFLGRSDLKRIWEEANTEPKFRIEDIEAKIEQLQNQRERVVAEKNRLIKQANQRNGLFGDTQALQNDMFGGEGFNPQAVLSQEQGFNAQIQRIDNEIALLKKQSATGKIEDSGQMTLFRAQTETKAFKDWFRNSKVVSKDGKPLIVYHGTSADFNTFDTNKQTTTAHGYGFYFTTDKEIAHGYTGRNGGQVMDAYISMQKPLRNDAKPFSKKELRNVINEMLNIELETYKDEMEDYKDSFLSNIVDTYSTSKDEAVNETVQMIFDGNDKAIDQIAELSNIIGDRQTTQQAVQKTLGYDGIFVENFQNTDSDVYVAWFPSQIKSASKNSGEFSLSNPDIRFRVDPVDVNLFKYGEGGTKGLFQDDNGTLFKSLVGTWRTVENGEVVTKYSKKDTNEYEMLKALQGNPNIPVIGERVITNEGPAFEIERLEELTSLNYDEYNEIKRILKDLNDQGYFVNDIVSVMKRPGTGELVVVDFSSGFFNEAFKGESYYSDATGIHRLYDMLSVEDQKKIKQDRDRELQRLFSDRKQRMEERRSRRKERQEQNDVKFRVNDTNTVYSSLLKNIKKGALISYLQDNGLSRDEINEVMNLNDTYWIDEYFNDTYGISVSENGFVQFDELTPEVRKIIGNNEVQLYHHTASGILKDIQNNGLQKSDKDVNRNNAENLGVYLTNEYSGPAVDGYKYNAVQAHGGFPLTLEVVTTIDQLQSDQNDADISSGRKQFVVQSINPEDILNLPDVDTESVRFKVDNAAQETNTNPTEPQKHAGNYKMGHVRFDGFDISIENPKGSIRSGKDKTGREWQQQLPADYGYFRGTKGRDKDHIDVFIGPKPENERIYVVDQIDPTTGNYDEAKVMLGFDNISQARNTYLAAYEPGWKGLWEITRTDKAGLKEWFDSGKTTQPFYNYISGQKPSVTKNEFHKKYQGQHKDIRGKGEFIKQIQEEGFKSARAWVLPVYKGGEPMDIVEKKYGNHKGDVIFLVPKEFVNETRGGWRVKEGWKPNDEDIITIEYDNQSSYEAFINKHKKNETRFRVDSKEFKDWFKDSKVTDEKGNPLRVYHGTMKEFDTFKNEFDGERVGIWFTDDKQEAETYAEETVGTSRYDLQTIKGTVKEVYLNIKNPAIWSEVGTDEADVAGYDSEIITDLIKQGYDGIKADYDGSTVWIAFEPEQIKPARNSKLETNDSPIRFAIRSTNPEVDQLFRQLDKIQRASDSRNRIKDLKTELDQALVFERPDILKQIKDLKEGIRLGQKDTKERIKAIQSAIIQYAQRNMPYDEVGKRDMFSVINKIRDAQTPGTIEKAFDKIDEITKENESNKNIRAVERLIKWMTNFRQKGQNKEGKFTYETVKEFEEFKRIHKESIALGAVKNNNRSSAKQKAEADKALEAMWQEINQKESKSLLDLTTMKLIELRRNGRKASKELIQAIREDLQTIYDAAKDAKTEEDIERVIYRKEDRDFVKQFLDGKPIQDRKRLDRWMASINGFLADTMGNWETILTMMGGYKMRDKFSLIINQVEKEVNTQEAFDKVMETAMKGYKLKDKKALQKKLNEMKKKEYSIVKPIREGDRGEGSDIPLSKLMLIDIYNAIQNEEIAEDMYLSYGDIVTNPDDGRPNEILQRRIGKERIDKLMENLDEGDIIFAQAMQQAADSYYEKINDVFIRTFNRDLPKRDNYWPSTAEFQNENDAFNQMLNDSLHPSATKERATRRTPKITDAFEKFAKHIKNAEWYANMALPVTRLNNIFKNPNVKDLIEDNYGENFYRLITEHLQEQGLYPKSNKSSLNQAEKAADWLLNNWVAASIGLTPSVPVKQLLSVINYSENMPVGKWTTDFIKNMANPANTWKEMMKIPYLKTRLGTGYSEAVQHALNSNEGVKRVTSIHQAMKEFATIGTRYGDIAAIAFGGKPYLDYLLSQGMSEKEAVDQFLLDTLRSQQSPFSSTLSKFQNRKTPLTRALFAFSNTPSQYMRKMVEGYHAYKKGDITKGQLAKVLTIYGVLNNISYVVVGALMGSLLSGNDWDDDLIKKLIVQTSTSVVGGIPFIKDIVELLANTATDSYVFDDVNPILEGPSETIKAINKAARSDDPEKAKKQMWIATKYFMQMFGISGRNLEKIYKATVKRGDLNDKVDERKADDKLKELSAPKTKIDAELKGMSNYYKKNRKNKPDYKAAEVAHELKYAYSGAKSKATKLEGEGKKAQAERLREAVIQSKANLNDSDFTLRDIEQELKRFNSRVESITD